MGGTNGIIYSDEKFMVPSHMNFGKYFVDTLLKQKENVALTDASTGKSITFGELAQQIVTIADALEKLNIKPGDVVGICSESRFEFLATTFAALSIGAVVTFINSGFSRVELVHTMSISKPTYMFMSQDAYKTHYPTMQHLVIVRKIWVFGNFNEPFRALAFKELTAKKVDIKSFKPLDFHGKDNTAIILYSSGTTGLPKGARLSHINLIVSHLREQTWILDGPVLSTAPWCNTVGLLRTTQTLANGRPVVFLPRYEENLFLQSIEKFKIKSLLVVPPLAVLLSKTEKLNSLDVSSVELMSSGGASLDLQIIQQVKGRFPNLKYVLQGYGMTEMTGALTEERPGVSKVGSVGKVMPGAVLKVVDVETRKTLGPNQPGEICAIGPLLFHGYVGRKFEDDFDKDGYYRTGDIAYYDEEGYFFIVDRIKSIIKYKAWQVSPVELEAVLLQHPEVKDVGVVGTPDPVAGELPTALIVKNKDSKVTEKDIIDFVKAKVSKWKQIRGGVLFVNEIPKNASGKILRLKLREIVTKKSSSKL